ncbi:ENTH-domain-containing protein [Coniophora puteana RWD-64-598 SS2]|uniref:ENTH-domain-containing protein n=1 Tax=Coniophora puteana (strain RWD-64-598) TaxID=741705 RepID=A0A5M3MEV1_CONPW|nr:ENTH-domain-containing protein [Coniophora puteana RWD-64-598 SS2]EIW77758.1 ENTH-domain-containing protein [Coniophora puteana RWD-64-598 SS2]
MSLQHFGKGALRVAKNYTKGYSETQAKVRDATSNDPWGPSGTQMNEIAQLTYNQGDFVEIMEMLDKRLNDKGKNWRHVFKSLTVLDYCLHAGSENVVIYFRDNVYIIKTLKEFQYVDEDGKDQGVNVRQKAKDITNLLVDENRLREERRSRASMRDRMVRSGPGDEDGGSAKYAPPVGAPPRRRGGGPDDEDELRRAIEESKRTLAEEQRKAHEDDDLAQAIRMSEEEESKRNKAVEDSNANALFDEQNQLSPNGNNSAPFVDPTPYATGLNPQYTMQPQFTSFNPYQQQAQQEAMQAEYFRQQQEWQQQQEMLQQQQMQAQMQAQQQAQQEEWFRQQQLAQMQQQQQQQQMLMAQPTGFGSNNPFAPAQPSPTPPMPSLNTSVSSSNGPSFNLQGTYANSPAPAFSSPSPAASSPRPESASAAGGPSRNGTGPRPTRADAEHAHLADLFANRDDGQDTFGNVGLLRYGQTDHGRIAATKTGGSHNPFQMQQMQQQQQQQYQQQQQQQGHDQPFFSL